MCLVCVYICVCGLFRYTIVVTVLFFAVGIGYVIHKSMILFVCFFLFYAAWIFDDKNNNNNNRHALHILCVFKSTNAHIDGVCVFC